MQQFQPGDIAACYGSDLASRLISYGTFSLRAPRRLRLGPSHVAILCAQRTGMAWVESTTLCRHRCLWTGQQTSGVQAHLPEQRIADYCAAGGRVDIYRLSPIDSLSTAESQLLTTILRRHFAGRSYDMAGALVSGTRLLKYSRLLFGADLETQFCSEMLAALAQRLGRMNRANPTRYSPASLLRELVQDGTYQYAFTARARDLDTPLGPSLRVYTEPEAA